MKTFEKLLLGSAELHRMTASISQIAKSTVGLLNPSEAEVVGDITIPSGKQHEWRVQRVLRIRKGEPNVSRWAVEFYEKGGYDEPPFKLIYSTHPVSQREPALEDVEMTYWALEDLVNYFMGHRKFRSKLRPLLEAATSARIKELG